MAVPAVSRGSRAQAPQRFEPFRDLEELNEQMGQLVQSVSPEVGDGKVWSPLVDIGKIEDAGIIEAELPGVRRGDVSVEARENEIAISDEIKERERQGILRETARLLATGCGRTTTPSARSTCGSWGSRSASACPSWSGS